MNVGSNDPTANKKEAARTSNTTLMPFVNPTPNKKRVVDQTNFAKTDRSAASVGWGRRPAIHPWAFRGRATRVWLPGQKRPEIEDKEVRTASTAGNLEQASSKMHDAQLLGPRISHIGKQSATVATTMLAGLATNQSKTGTIFQQPNFKSRARALGRPLGYGTVYKFI